MGSWFGDYPLRDDSPPRFHLNWTDEDGRERRLLSFDVNEMPVGSTVTITRCDPSKDPCGNYMTVEFSHPEVVVRDG